MEGYHDIVNDSIYDLEEMFYHVELVSGNEIIKKYLQDYQEQFPMVCWEKTDDSPFQVSIDESKFLNDNIYDRGLWIYIADVDKEPYALINLLMKCDSVEIQALEVAEQYRKRGIGKFIVNTIIDNGKHEYKYIEVSAFDTCAAEFWKHLGFKEKDGKLVKKIR